MSPGFPVPWWVLLVGAIAAEVAGTASLRLSEGLTRPLPALGVFIGYAIAIVLFSRVLERGIGLGVAYGMLTATGLLAATGLSAWVFDEPISWLQLVGVLILLAGLLALQVPPRKRPQGASPR
ncbi:multidrug efflux SMR transporter [Pseudonocardia sp. MH-G8]|uniref:DMT family transporter n=1 Tax=Pseudonocardia sp. MH-G8 TaxID=1854588 RepID=UPI00130435D9|nr:SMR family transporter [Pseudonocardia sp. MH-G8]